MGKMRKFYRKSGWYAVFNFRDEGANARTHLMLSNVVQAVVNGFSGGIFYTGLLMGYGINIVNISIITFIPYIASFFTLLTPFVLERFPKRRRLLMAANSAYYLISILGITILPWVVQDPGDRVVGLIILVFLANSINFLFSGYSPWHMPYITENVRTSYYSAISLVSNISSYVVLIIASVITDRLHPDAQLDAIIIMRFVALAIAGLDIYCRHKPKEPEYLVSDQKHSVMDIFRLPLSNKRFRLTMLVDASYNFAANFSASVSQAWLLQEIKTGYLYLNAVGFTYCLFVLLTSSFWSKLMRKRGTFWSFAFACFVMMPSYIAFAFVAHENYLWLLTAVRIVQYGISMLLTFSINNMLYISLPEADQTNYTSCYAFFGYLAVFLGMSTGTAIVAAMGERCLKLPWCSLSAPAVVILLQGILMGLLGLLGLLVRKWIQSDKKQI